MITTDCIRRVNVDDAQCHQLAGSCILIPPPKKKIKKKKKKRVKPWLRKNKTASCSSLAQWLIMKPDREYQTSDMIGSDVKIYYFFIFILF